MEKILVFGTFDGLHQGHKDFFRQAKEFGDFLVVVVGRDSTVQRVKNRLPKFNENERLEAVQKCGLVDEARLGNAEHNSAPGQPDEKFNPYKVIEEIKPDIICLGYDQTHFTEKLEEKLKEMRMEHVEIKRLKPYKPEVYKSSILNK